MEGIRPRLTFGDIFGYVMAYLGWFATAMVGMASILLFRNAFNIFWAALGTIQTSRSDLTWSWLLRPIDRFGLVLGGLVWLAYVIYCEQAYRSSITVKREQRFRVETDHLYTPPAPPVKPVMRFLHRMELDILTRRFAITFVIPLILLVLSWLLMQISTWIIT